MRNKFEDDMTTEVLKHHFSQLGQPNVKIRLAFVCLCEGFLQYLFYYCSEHQTFTRNIHVLSVHLIFILQASSSFNNECNCKNGIP